MACMYGDGTAIDAVTGGAERREPLEAGRDAGALLGRVESETLGEGEGETAAITPLTTL